MQQSDLIQLCCWHNMQQLLIMIHASVVAILRLLRRYSHVQYDEQMQLVPPWSGQQRLIVVLWQSQNTCVLLVSGLAHNLKALERRPRSHLPKTLGPAPNPKSSGLHPEPKTQNRNPGAQNQTLNPKP